MLTLDTLKERLVQFQQAQSQALANYNAAQGACQLLELLITECEAEKAPTPDSTPDSQ